MHKIDENTIQRELFKLNIPYDMKIIQEIYTFLDKFIGLLTFQDAQYHIPASCAIICQTLKIPTIDQTGFTGTGIKIENVMRHVGNLSKQKFLETIQMQIKKSGIQQHCLAEKVVNIKIAFRVFKKYKTIFENLSLQSNIPSHSNYQLLAFFWIIFLIAKINLHALEDLNLSTKILALIIQEVFCNFYGRLSRQRVRDFISQKDNFSQISKFNQNQQKLIKAQINNIFNKTLKNRDGYASSTRNDLLTNQILLSRLVDDMNSHYEKLFQALPDGRLIDELTFLQLTKNLTPQAFVAKPKQEPISQVLSFDDDDQQSFMNDDFQATQGKKPFYAELGQNIQKSLAINLFSSPTFNCIEQKRQRTTSNSKPMVDFTPVSLGQTKSTWAQSLINKFDNELQKQLINYFNKVNISFDSFINVQKQKIRLQIQSLTPYILNKDKSLIQTVKMALCLSFQILSRKPQTEILEVNYFTCILCLSAYLYNSTTRYLTIQLQKYTQTYQADLINCLYVIYDISDNPEMPLLIKQMLQQLEKQVLIKQLWDSDRGYQLFSQPKNIKDQIIFNRLDRKIYERIKQICVAIKVDLIEVQKIEALVKQIVNKKTQMLKSNKLDQIILCSISACLNLNEAKYGLALSTIFQKYNNSVPLSLNSNRQINMNKNQDQGIYQTLLQYYNSSFIHEVQDMLSQQQNPKYLYTPIRENHLRKLKDQSFTLPSPNVMGGLANRELPSALAGRNYRKYREQIIDKMKQKQKQEILGSNSNSDSNSQDQKQSPRFGTESVKLQFSLKRKFTFGPNN